MLLASGALAEDFSIRNLPLEERVCPDVTRDIILDDGRRITRNSSLFCYSETHKESDALGGRTDVDVFYEEEGVLRKDAWSGPQGYTKIARQLLIRYDKAGVNYEVWFITSPNADGRGFYDREGGELLFLTRTEPEARMTNDFVWLKGLFYNTIIAKEENRWEEGTHLHARVENVMTIMRKKTYHAAKTLREYRMVDDEKDDDEQGKKEYIRKKENNQKKESPIIISDEEIADIARRTERLYEIAKYKE